MAQSAIESIIGPQGAQGPEGDTVARQIFDFGGDNFDLPNNADWQDGTPAAIIVDPTNNALVVAAMDDTDDEGVGGELYIPTAASDLILNWVHRAASAPTGDQTVDYRFYFRKITDNGAIGSWTLVNIAAMTIPDATATYQYEQQRFDLTTIGMDAGAYYQWELLRYPGGTDTLSGDLYLRKFRIETDWGRIRWYPADVMRSANNSDWAINANAPIAADSNNAALKVRLHDDTTEEGSGISMLVPGGASTLKLHLISRGEDATGGNVEVTMHYRKLPDNAAVETWQDEDMASVVVIPTSELWQYDNWAMTLSSLTTAIVPGTQYQFQITRNAGAGTDTYAADWAVLAIGFEFY